MSTFAFSKIQYGKESKVAHGTPVAATDLLAGAEIKGIPNDRKPTFIEDAIGVRAASARSNVYELLVEDTLSVPHAYFQAVPLFFSCGLKGDITPTETTGGQGDYAWAFTPSMTTSNTPDSMTVQMGDDTQEYTVEYVMFKTIKVSGTIDQGGGDSPVSIEGNYFGRQFTAATFTPGLSIPAMTTMNAKQAKLYKDTAWAGKGVTELAGVLRGFEFEVMTGVHPKFFGSADKYFTTHGESVIGAMLTLTLEWDATTSPIYTDYQNETARAYAIKIAGPQIGSGANHGLNMFIWGKPESVIPLSSQSNGNNLVSVVIHGVYDTVGAQIVDVDCTTSSNTI